MTLISAEYDEPVVRPWVSLWEMHFMSFPIMTLLAWPQVHHTLENKMVHVIWSLNMFWNHVPNPGSFVTQCLEPQSLSFDIRLNKLTTSSSGILSVQVQKTYLIQDVGYRFQHKWGTVCSFQQFNIRWFIIIRYHACPFVDLFHFVSRPYVDQALLHICYALVHFHVYSER